MKIICAFDLSPHSLQALKHTAEICSKLNSYQLLVINVIALTPESKLPFLDHLEGALNIEVEEAAVLKKLKLEELLETMHPKVDFEFRQIEGHGDTGEIFEEYLKDIKPDLVIIGSSHKQGLEKYSPLI